MVTLTIRPSMTESLTTMVGMTAPTIELMASTVKKMSSIIGLLALGGKLAASTTRL